MLYVMTIGNSELTFGLFESGDLRAHWRLPTDHNADPGTYRRILTGAFQEHAEDIARSERALISSVVPPLNEPVASAVGELLGVEPEFLRVDWDTGLSFSVADPRELGSDLIANCAGALKKFGRSCIVIDFGTTTTFTAMARSGNLLGVAITPGILTSMDAMVGSTASLPFVRLAVPEQAIGRSTEEALQAGLTYGYASMADGMVKRFSDEMMEPAPMVVATGTFAHLVAAESEAINAVEPLLTLEGLLAIAERNPR